MIVDFFPHCPLLGVLELKLLASKSCEKTANDQDHPLNELSNAEKYRIQWVLREQEKRTQNDKHSCRYELVNYTVEISREGKFHKH